MERRLIGEYRELILSLVGTISDANMPAAIELAGAAASIAGYGPVKGAGVAAYRERVEDGLEAFKRPASMPAEAQPQPELI